ncbi:MAG TPA: HEPN family nuclease, partial [Lacipirellulaceae bacterium]|nr:HEPN family nuclease [Lacipirellulaceae bacterium]
NLEFVEAAVKDEPHADIFEVTQLINSMLGLLVFPKEHFAEEEIPDTPLDELRAQGWPIPVMKGSPPRAQNLRELVRCLRNGIAHFHVDFTSDGQYVTGLRIWNPPRGRDPLWEARLDVPQLREIARKFISLLLEANT